MWKKGYVFCVETAITEKKNEPGAAGGDAFVNENNFRRLRFG
jgi:HKD family nuclease